MFNNLIVYVFDSNCVYLIITENLSNEESTWEEIMQIKAMPVPMAQKRELKAQLQVIFKIIITLLYV